MAHGELRGYWARGNKIVALMDWGTGMRVRWGTTGGPWNVEDITGADAKRAARDYAQALMDRDMTDRPGPPPWRPTTPA